MRLSTSTPLILVLLFMVAPLAAEEIDESDDASNSENTTEAADEPDERRVTGSARQTFIIDDGFGGPKTIGAQLERDNTSREYRFPVRVFRG